MCGAPDRIFCRVMMVDSPEYAPPTIRMCFWLSAGRSAVVVSVIPSFSLETELCSFLGKSNRRSCDSEKFVARQRSDDMRFPIPE